MFYKIRLVLENEVISCWASEEISSGSGPRFETELGLGNLFQFGAKAAAPCVSSSSSFFLISLRAECDA